jgi:hypothetical protein
MRWAVRLGWLLLLACWPGFGGTVSMTGSLSSSDPNDVFQYSFTLLGPADLDVQSWGYGGGTNAAGVLIPPGGFDAYLSLFQGSGPDAVFWLSDDDGGCPPGAPDFNCRDPRLHVSGAPAGDYVLTITTFGNFSVAENYGGGILGEGFIGLGSYYDQDNQADRSPAFAVDVSVTDAGPAVPEPSTRVLVLIPMLLLLVRMGRVSAGL